MSTPIDDTPVTDAREADVFIGCSHHDSGDVQEAYDFARNVERVANRMAAMLREVRRFLPSHGTWADGGIDRFETVLRDFEELRQQISPDPNNQQHINT